MKNRKEEQQPELDQTADSYFYACTSKQYPTSRTDRMVNGALGAAWYSFSRRLQM